MTPFEISLTVFASVFAGAVLGMSLRTRLPEHHVSDSAKYVIGLGMGLIATVTALVLGLVIASAKNSYDAQQEAIKHSAAKVLLLDRVLASYGPETKDARVLLRNIVESRVDAIWPEDRSRRRNVGAVEVDFAGQQIATQILQLSPQNDAQRWLQSQALQLGNDISETRWLILGELEKSVPVPFLVVVVFWLTMIFGSFGLFAPRNATVVGALFLCAMSVAGAMFLILEMQQPFEGVMKLSGAPLRYALAHLGQ